MRQNLELNGDPARMDEGEDDVLSGLGVGEDPGSRVLEPG